MDEKHDLTNGDTEIGLLESNNLTQWVETEPDEYGPMADQLKSLFIDEVDPLTAEVIRRPIFQETVFQIPDLGPLEKMSRAQSDEITFDPVMIFPLPNEIAIPVKQVELTDPIIDTDEAMGSVVNYLLSPEGTELRKQLRQAAYEARKSAYESAHEEIVPQIEAVQARIKALQTAPQKAHLDDTPEAKSIAAAQQAWQEAQTQSEIAAKALQAVQEQLDQSSLRIEKADALASQGKLPALILTSFEADHEKIKHTWEQAQMNFAQVQQTLRETTEAWQAVRAGIQDTHREQEELLQQEKEAAEFELESLENRLKERQEVIASSSPEVILWKAVQAERRRREDELAEKLARSLPSQGIRKTLLDANRLGIQQNDYLLQAITQRQMRVNTLIEACRSQAERLAAFPEVLPENAFALLVRGDAIRVVDSQGCELSVHFANEGGEFHVVPSKNSRRWKLQPERDCWWVKR